MTKRKSVNKTRAKPARVFSTSKRRGHDVYNINLPNAYRTRDDLNNIISKAKLNIPSDLIEGGQVKITLYAKRYSAYGSITLIHDIDNKPDLRDSVQYTLDWIFRKLKPGEVVKNTSEKYLRPGNPLNNYINKIIIDFETND
jgi:hypothetical protein